MAAPDTEADEWQTFVDQMNGTSRRWWLGAALAALVVTGIVTALLAAPIALSGG